MPSPRVAAILELVADMRDEERAELLTELDRCAPEEWTSAWNDELVTRMEQIEHGKVRLLTREEFFAGGEPPR